MLFADLLSQHFVTFLMFFYSFSINNKLWSSYSRAGHSGASVSEMHNGLEMLLSFSKVKIDFANIVWQTNRE